LQLFFAAIASQTKADKAVLTRSNLLSSAEI